MPIFKTIEPVLYDGQHYLPESEIELSDKDAKPLLKLGAIEKASVKKPAPAAKEPAVKAAPVEMPTAENTIDQTAQAPVAEATTELVAA